MNRIGLQGYFKKDFSTLCILALLNRSEEVYGYELMLALDRYSEGHFVLPEGTLYPVLYRLEEQGFVVSEKRLISKRLQRVYYRITAEGRLFYQQMRDTHASIQYGVNRLLAFCDAEENKDEE